MAQLKVPPNNTEAEKLVLGSIMLDSSTWDDVSAILSESDFYLKSHQIIYKAMRELNQKGQPIDLITVTDYLQTKSEIISVGGHDYISELVGNTISAVNIEMYANLVKDKSVLRLAILASNEIADKAYQESFSSIGYFLDEAEEKFFKLSENRTSEGLVPSMNIVHQAMLKIEALYQQGSEITGISSGLPSLDKMTSGFQPSELTIIAARPSMGKTAFSLNIAETMALKEKKTVAYFSLEMSKESLVSRLLSMVAKINMKETRTGKLDEYSWPRMIQAASILSESKLFIDDTSSVSPLEIRSRCRKLKSQHGLDCVIIDYLQLMKMKERVESREREVAEISRTLKAIAKELQIPVIALAQLNRGVEGRQEKRPMLSDLRESGSIEQDADVIMLLYRDDYYDKDDSDKKGRAEVIIGKQRNGPTGTVKLSFEAELGRFKEAEPEYSPQFNANSGSLGSKRFEPTTQSNKTKASGAPVNYAPSANKP